MAFVENSGEWSGSNQRGSPPGRWRPHAQRERLRRNSSITFRLKDWGISRQRYWGTPIPIVYCPQGCGAVPVAGKRDLAGAVCQWMIKITGKGRSPLEQPASRVHASVPCPNCAGPGSPRKRHHGHVRRFLLVLLSLLRSTGTTPHRSTPEALIARSGFPIDQYIGGVEHAILHLIYSRFWTKMMRDIGVITNTTSQRQAAVSRKAW